MPLDSGLPPDLHEGVGAPHRRQLLIALGLAAAYVAAGKLGIALTSVAHGVITPVWAPSGLAIAALLACGRGLWPAVAVGAFTVNATSGAGLLVAACIAAGNTLEAVVAVTLLRRLAFRLSLARVRDAVTFAAAALASAIVAASIGTTVLDVAGRLRHPYGTDWLLWWSGDSTGALLVAPALLVLPTWRRELATRRRRLEACALVGALGAMSGLLFFTSAWRFAAVLFPLLVWAPLRFRRLGGAAAALLVAAVAIAGAVHGSVQIGGSNATERVQILQALLAVVALTLLVLAASLEERETAERRLVEAQELAHLGSWEWTIEGDRLAWSEELCRICGVARAPVGRDGLLAAAHPDDRDDVAASLELALRDRAPFAVDFRVVRPSGETRYVAMRAQVVTGEGAQPLRLVGTMIDVTERERVEQLRSNILAAVSHELRTPLTAILGFAVTLQSRLADLPEQEVRAMIEQVAGQARRLEALLSDLLDIERLRHGLLAPALRTVDLATLVEHALAQLRLDDHVIELELVSALITGDPPKLERIVENLALNAAKYSPRGSVVRVRVERRASEAALVVEDEGPGVPQELGADAFDLFVRGANAVNTRGAGIGLSLVSQFARFHGGRATVENRPEGGARFTVLLPLADPAAA
jgi:PAS domain S-box-containing protein